MNDHPSRSSQGFIFTTKDTKVTKLKKKRIDTLRGGQDSFTCGEVAKSCKQGALTPKSVSILLPSYQEALRENIEIYFVYFVLSVVWLHGVIYILRSRP